MRLKRLSVAKSLGGVVADALTDHAAKAVPVIALVLVDAQAVVLYPATLRPSGKG